MNIQTSRLILFSAVLFVLFSCKEEKKPIKIKKSNKKEVTAAEPEPEKEVEGRILTEIQSNFLQHVMREDIGKQKYDYLQTEKAPYSVHFTNDGDPYSVSYDIIKEQDFNNDGIVDYVLNVDSTGMLGGNANTNQTFVYYIMQDVIIYQETHTILGYAPFSYNIIDDAVFDGDKFKVKITQNFRTYMNDNLKSASLSFVYKDGNLYEESYLSDCLLAQLDSKTIFHHIPEVTKRVRDIEWHNYTETISEIYQKGDTLIHAELEGCDNLLLTFDTEYKVDKTKLKNAAFRKNTALKLLHFLSAQTQFSVEINEVIEYFEENPITDKYIESVEGYGFRILIQQNDPKQNKLRFLVQIDKIDNPYQKENWEIATRNKTAPDEEGEGE
ncbi:hypothetical protein [Flavobacterium hungaricum]|uniref:Lipoprotein n=1 Tax=Flavobacterium hungaricum TaxID=2082725 RepID=A0ABR9TN68_9FLAO|nr:hypothetical protein [Flavobacterium hungaricum]MBE8726797.1 hypothetical protein [Flavobacterium hungaricum]